MVTVLLILATLAMLLLAGIAVKATISPGGQWVDLSTLPLGAALLMALSVPTLIVMPGTTAGPVVAGLVCTLVAIGILRRARASGGIRRALRSAVRPTSPSMIPLGIGVVGAFVFLIPVFRDGAGGIVSISNNDGWYYAAAIDWFGSHRLNAPLASTISEPLGAAVATLRVNHLPVGFESMTTVINGIFRRPTYEMVMPVAAMALPLAACGWAWLARLLSKSADRGVAAVAALGMASPLLLLAFSEAYVNQAMGLALVPAAIAAGLALSRMPDVPSLVVAALAMSVVIGAYPSLLPWVLLPLALVMLWRPEAGCGWLPWALPTGWLQRTGRAVVLMCLLALATAVVAPVQAARAVSFITNAAGFSGAAGFIAYTPRQYAFFALGAKSSPPSPMTGIVMGSGLLIIAALGVTIATAVRRPDVRRALGILAALALAGFVVWYRYGQLDFVYGVYKSVISTGALLGGALMVAIACVVPARRLLAAVAAVAVVVAWAPSGRQLLLASETTISGFRTQDFALVDRVSSLPRGSVVLVEGAAADWDIQLFQSRMIGAFAEEVSSGVDLEGLGSTYSYISPGPLPEWRPTQPWGYTVQTRPSPFQGGRTGLWAEGVYSLKRAPVLDASPYGDAWYNVEYDGVHAVQWTSGPAEILLSNRSPRPRRAVLSVVVTSAGVGRRVVLGAEGRQASAVAPVGVRTIVRLAVAVPARRVVSATLSSTPGALPVPPDSRLRALRVESVRLAPASGSAGVLGRVRS